MDRVKFGYYISLVIILTILRFLVNKLVEVILNTHNHRMNVIDTLIIILFTEFIMEVFRGKENTEDAFRMFTILNNMGIPLTSADIIKSQNIGELSTEREVKNMMKYGKILKEGMEKDLIDSFNL